MKRSKILQYYLTVLRTNKPSPHLANNGFVTARLLPPDVANRYVTLWVSGKVTDKSDHAKAFVDSFAKNFPYPITSSSSSKFGFHIIELKIPIMEPLFV